MIRWWARFKKIFLLLAVTIALLCAWPASLYPNLKLPPPPPIPVIEPPPPPAPLYEENYYDVKLNGVLIDTGILTLKDKQGNLWLPITILKNMNFALPDSKPLTYDGDQYDSLNSFPGVTYNIDTATLTLNLTVPINVFKHNTVDMGGSQIVVPTIPPWGGFLNYDFLTTNTSNNTNVNALFGLGIFGPYGYGSSTFTYMTQKSPRPFVRLLTTWTIDKPDVMKTLSLGDNVSQATNWSGSVNYGGIQWGTNFNTQPAFYTFPLPGYRGAAIIPSTIDLFVNSNMVAQQKVAPGVFDITNIPMVDGAGNVKIITKDILGRNQVVTANYYISTSLLKKGLSSYTYDLGLIRQNLGVFSNQYSQALGAITYGYGFTDSTTAQAHVEALSYEQAAGLTLTQLVDHLGVFTGSIAGSQQYNFGKGGLGQLSFQRQTQTLNFGASTQFTTAHFSQSGIQQGTQSPKMITQIFGSYPFGASSFSVNYTKELNRGSPSSAFITATYATTFFHSISLSFTMIDTIMGPGTKSYFLSLSYAFNDDIYLNAGYNNNNGPQTKSLQLIKQLPTGPGYGYDMTINRGNTDSDEASLSLQNDVGTYILQGTQTYGSQTSSLYSLDVSGGLIYMSKHLKFSRTINGSFGLVETLGHPGIDIYSENQLIARTNDDGVALIPNLLPYQKMKVNLDPNSVPLNTDISSYEATVIPYANSGVLIPFEITVIRNAVMTLKMPSGKEVPEGAVITLKGQTNQFLSGMNGEVFVTGASDHNEGHASWEGNECDFAFDLPAVSDKDPIPNAGNVICKPSGNAVKNTNQGATTNAGTKTNGQPTQSSPTATPSNTPPAA